VHEVVEKALVDLFRLSYSKAYHIATHVESVVVRNSGINWWAYTKFLRPQIKQVEHEKLNKTPPDLDRTPYGDLNKNENFTYQIFRSSP